MDEERYEINSLLGKGRTGGVYVAEDTQLKRTVAVRRFYSAGGDTSSENWEQEFIAIAQNLGNLQDPNLLTVLDAGVDEDGAFLVAQKLEGKRLSEFVSKTPLTEHEAHEMATQLLDALALSHEAGFIHGALTAGSIMLTERARGGYRYIIMDMGLSRLAPLIQGADSSYAMMADPALLAPELFNGEAATEVSDCYMIGHLVYLSLIGGHPFALKPIDEVKELHQSGALPPLTTYREGISPAFVDWINTLTNPDIAKRPQSAAAALKSLASLLPKSPTTNPAAPAGAIAKKNSSVAPTLIKIKAPAALQTPAENPQAKAPVLMTKHAVAKQPTAATPSPTAPPAPKLATATSPTTPSFTPPQTPPVSMLGSAQPKGKKKLILAITLAVVLIAGVCLALRPAQDKDKESFYQESFARDPITEEQEPSTEKADRAPSLKTTNVKPLFSRAVGEEHSRLDCDVNIRGQIDWAVFRAQDRSFIKYSHATSDVIKGVTIIGGAKRDKKSVGNLLFTDGSREIIPSLFAKTSSSGDGFKIEIITPQVKSLTLTLYFAAWNCEPKLRILSADGTSQLISEHIYQHPSENTSFASEITLTEAQLQADSSFFLELTATAVKQDSGLSLNALMLK